MVYVVNKKDFFGCKSNKKVSKRNISGAFFLILT